jgi:hypothetical protein
MNLVMTKLDRNGNEVTTGTRVRFIDSRGWEAKGVIKYLNPVQYERYPNTVMVIWEGMKDALPFNVKDLERDE